MDEYVPRLVDPLLTRLLQELPALLIVGPRATGKTTTAARHAQTVIRLDRPADAEAFRADPDAALRGLTEPVLLDEWQEVPEILGALKRTLDNDSRPGRYIVAGSVRADLDAVGWPATGRLVRIPMAGMTIKEQLRAAKSPSLVDRIADGTRLDLPSAVPDLRDYVELALRSGFPEAALRLTSSTRALWLAGYLEQVLTRDVNVLTERERDPARLRRFFEAYALNTAGLVSDTTLFEAAGINARTARAYEHLLANLLIIDMLPAWTTNRLKRLVLRPKRYVTDVALLAGVRQMTVDIVMRDGDLLGRVLETFVASQLRAEIAVSETRPRLYHLRTESGRHEIDLLAEIDADRVIAFEVKADASPGPDAAKHLSWLRDELEDRFIAGVVLHTGPRVYELGDRVIAAPICALWP